MLLAPLLPLLMAFDTGIADQPCEQPLTPRTVTPSTDAEDVPVDSRILVSFIGLGSADEYEVELSGPGESVEVARRSWCYEHEGPFEVHCWWELTPAEQLEAEQEYRIEVRSTGSWQGEGEAWEQYGFRTGTEEHPELLEGAVDFEVVEIVDLAGEEVGECDYAQPRRMLITPAGEVGDTTGQGVFQIEERLEDGSHTLMHTVLATNPVQEGDYLIKQYADLTSNPTGCYRIWFEDGAGAARPKSSICWDEENETDIVDTSIDETGGLDTAGDETDVTETGDTGGDETANPEEQPREEGVPPQWACGCNGSGTKGWPLGLLMAGGLVGLRGRRGVGLPR